MIKYSSLLLNTSVFHFFFFTGFSLRFPIFDTNTIRRSLILTGDLSVERPTLSIDFKVYIENTDAFGVTFYANYPVWFERALCLQRRNSSGRLKSFKLLKLRNAGSI